MKFKTILATGASLPALALALAPAAGANPPKVSVRVEGKKRTLLPSSTIKPHPGAVKKNGHSCSASSGAGALNTATHGHWSAKWFAGLGFDVTKILGETGNFTKTKSYWELFVNNVAASVGICALKLHGGDQLLFADVPASGTEYPSGVRVPEKPVVGHPFKVKVVYYDASGKPRPLAGATVVSYPVSSQSIPHSRVTAKTNAKGIATMTETRVGLTSFGASKRGYIRAAMVVRDVT